jgi:hypothetical protein
MEGLEMTNHCDTTAPAVFVADDQFSATGGHRTREVVVELEAGKPSMEGSRLVHVIPRWPYIGLRT